MTDRHHLLVHGGTFAAVGDGGDISGVRGGSSPDGLFVRDARHLSRWQLTVDGAVPEALTPVADGDMARCVLVPRGGRQEPPAHTLFREQAVGDGAFVESLKVTSNRPVPTTVRLAVTADADFTDQFELRSDHRTYAKTGVTRSRQVLEDGVEFAYQRGEWRSCTTVTAEPAPDGVEETGTGARRMVWTLDLEPHGTAELALRVMARPHGDKRALRVPRSPSALNEQLLALEGEYVQGVSFPTGWPELAAACARGLSDLASLQVPAKGPDGEELRVPAAGAPWFLTLLGRDALLTSLFALPYRPQLAAATLPSARRDPGDGRGPRVGLPARQDRARGAARRAGALRAGAVRAVLRLGRRDPAVPGAARRVRGADRRLHPRPAAGAQRPCGDRLDAGPRRPDVPGLPGLPRRPGRPGQPELEGLPGAICGADGTRASGAVMAAGAQGYAYDALRRTAWVARTVWEDETYAALLEQAASDLRDRFQRDFWMREHSFPALALDGEGRQVDALASDAGHLLWSGLLDKEYGELVGRRLLAPDFFSGWGVRTLASGQAAYHPLSYHRGSVWPHDNALITLGLARYGLHDEARTVAHALVDAATATGHRLPEVLAGYGRDTHPEPVPYPHACVRESRSAAAPLALLTAVGGA